MDGGEKLGRWMLKLRVLREGLGEEVVVGKRRRGR
jgi:hypothetical protein